MLQAMANRLSRWLIGPPEAEISAGVRRPPQPIVSGGSRLPLPPITVSSYSRLDALGIPTISRARDLTCGFLGALPLRSFNIVFDESRAESIERDIPPPDWCFRLDPAKPKTFTISGLADDLLFYGVGYLMVLDRFSTGYPKAFRWVPADEVVVQEDTSTLAWTPTPRSGFYTGRGDSIEIKFADIIEFSSPFVPVLEAGTSAISTARNLQEAVDRFSTVALPTGTLRQTEGEPLSPKERQDEAARFSANRLMNTTAFLPIGVAYDVVHHDPERMQLVEARTFQTIELARLTNVPGSLLDIAISSMTYSNQRDGLTSLWFFGLLPLATAMSQVFSGPNVTPRGTWIAFDPTILVGQPDQWAGANPAQQQAPDNVTPINRQQPGSGPTGQVRDRPADTSARGN